MSTVLRNEVDYAIDMVLHLFKGTFPKWNQMLCLCFYFKMYKLLYINLPLLSMDAFYKWGEDYINSPKFSFEFLSFFRFVSYNRGLLHNRIRRAQQEYAQYSSWAHRNIPLSGKTQVRQAEDHVIGTKLHELWCFRPM